MSTNTTLKLALELAAKVTGREDLAALASEVQELGPISDETAAETTRLAETLESLSSQQALIQQFNDSKAALTQLELATVLSRDKLEQLRRSSKQAPVMPRRWPNKSGCWLPRSSNWSASWSLSQPVIPASTQGSSSPGSIPRTLPRNSSACSVS
ncbi:hypothetical protein ACTG1J_01515 [Aeromonas veronii]|uniref:hypothetical protein n=1 Tax=Aeromonas veronii TaxID=654 RepID=UPI003F790C69